MNKLLLFGAKWCQPCQQLKKRMHAKFMEFEYLDIQENFDMAKDYSIQSVPTLVVINNGIPVASHVGVPRDRQLYVLVQLSKG